MRQDRQTRGGRALQDRQRIGQAVPVKPEVKLQPARASLHAAIQLVVRVLSEQRVDERVRQEPAGMLARGLEHHGVIRTTVLMHRAAPDAVDGYPQRTDAQACAEDGRAQRVDLADRLLRGPDQDRLRDAGRIHRRDETIDAELRLYVRVPVEDHKKSAAPSAITGTLLATAASSSASIASSIAPIASSVSIPLASARCMAGPNPAGAPGS